MIVRNVSRGPLVVDGCGALATGERGSCAETPHTAALIDAGHLVVVPDVTPAVPPPPAARPSRKPAPSKE